MIFCPLHSIVMVYQFFSPPNLVFGQYYVVLMRSHLKAEIIIYFYVLYGLEPKSQTCPASSNHLLRSVSQSGFEWQHPSDNSLRHKSAHNVCTFMPSDRNNKTTVEIGQIAEREGKTILGIKGSSALVDLPLSYALHTSFRQRRYKLYKIHLYIFRMG